MEPSLGGVLVVGALLVLGHLLGSALIIGLFASLPFGSTAFATLSALGGSSPLIYTVFVLLVLAATVLHRGFLGDLATVLATHWTAWVVLALIGYAVFSAVVFPRLFAGEATALVPTTTGVKELPLAPVSANITQAGYFVIGALTYFAFAIYLVRGGSLDIVRRGVLTWIVLHAGLGLVDLMGKATGIGDILAPIRTASYAYLVEVEEAGFWRIAGGYSEASAFGSVTLACLAFSYSYWRVRPSPPMLGLTALLFALLILSTSSTAYAGLAIVAPFAAVSMAVSMARRGVSRTDIVLVAVGWTGLIAVLCLYLFHEQLFDPFIGLFETMVLKKSMSTSALERAYWNWRSIDAFFATNGFGVGLGSSRASSWIIAVLSQLGVIGSMLMAALVGALLWDMFAAKRRDTDPRHLALACGLRSCVLASLAGASVSSGFADPGLQFFIALAVVAVFRKGGAVHPGPRFGVALPTAVG